MGSFKTVTDLVDPAQASHVNQYAQALSGVAGAGVPIALTALNDPVNYALAVRNQDAGGKTAVFYAADGSVLFDITNGVTTLHQPTIGDFTNAQHAHDAAGHGGVLATAALAAHAVTQIVSAPGSGGDQVSALGPHTYAPIANPQPSLTAQFTGSIILGFYQMTVYNDTTGASSGVELLLNANGPDGAPDPFTWNQAVGNDQQIITLIGVWSAGITAGTLYTLACSWSPNSGTLHRVGNAALALLVEIKR